MFNKHPRGALRTAQIEASPSSEGWYGYVALFPDVFAQAEYPELIGQQLGGGLNRDVLAAFQARQTVHAIDGIVVTAADIGSEELA